MNISKNVEKLKHLCIAVGDVNGESNKAITQKIKYRITIGSRVLLWVCT